MVCSPTAKTVAEKSFDVNKTAIKICRNKRPVSNDCFSLNKHGSYQLNFVYSITAFICQHCMNLDTKIIN